MTSFKRSQACSAALSAPHPAADHHWPTPLPETPGHSRQVWVSLVGSLLFSPGPWCALGSVCALPESVSPVLCKFWWLCGGLNGDLLQEGFCHTQVCCTQSLCPCSRPLPTRTSTGDTQIQLWLSLCGISGSWCTQGLFEPSDCLWWVWGLILNVTLLLLLSWWGCFFALGRGYLLLVGSNTLLLTVVQQQVVTVQFLHERMSTHPSSLPSSSAFTYHYLINGVF